MDETGDLIVDSCEMAYETELSQILDTITEIIDCLNSLTISMRHLAPHTRLMMSSKIQTAFTDQDAADAQNMFPQAEPVMTHRAARALSRLREHFTYMKLFPCRFEPSELSKRRSWRKDHWTLAFSMLGHPAKFAAEEITDLWIIDEAIVLDPNMILEKYKDVIPSSYPSTLFCPHCPQSVMILPNINGILRFFPIVRCPKQNFTAKENGRTTFYCSIKAPGTVRCLGAARHCHLKRPCETTFSANIQILWAL
ncbi:hypothetical protein VTJ49DRAFT_7005 [Mycothermus thermophilus]|uniref:Uncharacterized protein n=1 Tax=Humicola insolens TaxID=85995 RepID=A0ABR3V166_HUMIN